MANVVQANILAATAPLTGSDVFNVGLGQRTSLNELHSRIAAEVLKLNPASKLPGPVHGPARPGDIVHSQGDISKIQRVLGFEPQMSVEEGMAETVRWYAGRVR